MELEDEAMIQLKQAALLPLAILLGLFGALLFLLACDPADSSDSGDSSPLYTVTFDSAAATANAPKAQTVVRGAKISAPSPAPTKTGFSFAGWYADKSRTRVFDFATPITQNITLYAQWSSLYTVTFDSAAATANAPKAQTVVHGAKISAPSPAPTKTGFSFAGWYADKSRTRVFDFATPITQNITLYAQWSSLYTVTFDSDAATANAPKAQTVVRGTKISAPSPAPTKTGFSFAGWYADKSRTRVFDFATPITQNITLYARWGPPTSDLFAQFRYSDHDYYIVKQPKNWKAAAAYAKTHQGYLVHIGDRAEQTELEKQLGQIASQLIAADSTPKFVAGERGAALWLGATDQTTEGTWVWDGDDDGRNTQALGQGRRPRPWTGSAYQNWGKSFAGNQMEPDNMPDSDYAAIGFVAVGWGNGQQYQWNDVPGASTLYSIIEVE